MGLTRAKPLGNTSVPTMPYSDGALRCIQQGLGGSSQWPNTDRRSMVTRGSSLPYKLSRVVSSLPGNQSFREDLAECHSVTAHRQPHSSMLRISFRKGAQLPSYCAKWLYKFRLGAASRSYPSWQNMYQVSSICKQTRSPGL